MSFECASLLLRMFRGHESRPGHAIAAPAAPQSSKLGISWHLLAFPSRHIKVSMWQSPAEAQRHWARRPPGPCNGQSLKSSPYSSSCLDTLGHKDQGHANGDQRKDEATNGDCLTNSSSASLQSLQPPISRRKLRTMMKYGASPTWLFV